MISGDPPRVTALPDGILHNVNRSPALWVAKTLSGNNSLNSRTFCEGASSDISYPADTTRSRASRSDAKIRWRTDIRLGLQVHSWHPGPDPNPSTRYLGYPTKRVGFRLEPCSTRRPLLAIWQFLAENPYLVVSFVIAGRQGQEVGGRPTAVTLRPTVSRKHLKPRGPGAERQNFNGLASDEVFATHFHLAGSRSHRPSTKS